jgi:putative heme-binding domain-containing protein
VKLPPGFVAYLYSDQALANDIYTLTIDDEGRVLVAGKGYVRALVDDDHDGRADRAVTLLDNLKDGPMGLLAEGDSLYVVADGGLKRYRGYTGQDKLTTPPELIFKVKTSGEHEAHAVRRGPDGWLYLLCGNNSGIKKDQIDPHRSPVKDPVAGCLLRISPDGNSVEAVCDGFRNAYGFDFNLAGEPFAYDSDNERCVGLPWYEPCRFYHCVPGGSHGWRSPQLSQTWRKPPYFADVVPPVCTTGRGSPTGVACYRNTLFPGPYRGGFFIADWTFGRVYFVPLEPKGSTWAGKPEVFLEAVGESGFAPTALAVHPKTGELFVSIGGRGTRGAVYRIAHERGGPAGALPMAKRSLDWSETAAKEWLADATGADALKRRHALELMLRWRERIGWGQWLGDAVKPSLGHADALVRAAAGRLAVDAILPVKPLNDALSRLTFALAEVRTDPKHAFDIAVAELEREANTPDNRLIAVRALQLALGDLTAPDAVGTVWEGYTFRRPVHPAFKQQLIPVLTDLLLEEAAKSRDLECELGRTLAALGPIPQVPSRFYSALTAGSAVPDDIHNLIVAARLYGNTPLGTAIASRLAVALFSLGPKARAQGVGRDTNWPLRVGEVAAALGQHGPAFTKEMVADWKIAYTRPEHVVFVKAMNLPRDKAARQFVKKLQTWTPATVALLDALPPEERRPVLLKRWEEGGFEDAIIPILARDPDPADALKFVVGLRSLSPDVVKASAAALNRLPAQRDKADLIAAVGALRRLPTDKATAPACEAVVALLRDRSDQAFGPDAKAWAGWFTRTHPHLAAKLSSSDGFDPAAWRKREAAIPWADGDATRGKAVFAKATCAACHDGGGAVGPSLVGVAKRFSRDDLLTAILQPSKDVSPRYRPTRVTTTDGKAYVGMIVYEATSGVILQTGPAAVVRLAGEQIESQRQLDTSLMSAGLLDKLTDREVADLLAFLRGS